MTSQISEQKDEIISVINGIDFQLCENVIENCNNRMDVCRASRGGYSAHIIFSV